MATATKKTKKVITEFCKDCGAEFTISPEEQTAMELRGYELPRRCSGCRVVKRGNALHSVMRDCIDCGAKFELSGNEVNFYGRMHLELPKRCVACREVKKNRCNNGQDKPE